MTDLRNKAEIIVDKKIAFYKELRDFTLVNILLIIFNLIISPNTL